MIMPIRAVSGIILKLHCQSCGAEFPHFLFSGEEDTDTAGLCSASSCEHNDVAIIEAEPHEWNDFEGAGGAALERRLAQQLGRVDFKVVHLMRVEDKAVSAAGLSFWDYQKEYVPPVLIYSCPCCKKGGSRSISELTVKDFQRVGGQVLVLGHLTLEA